MYLSPRGSSKLDIHLRVFSNAFLCQGLTPKGSVSDVSLNSSRHSCVHILVISAEIGLQLLMSA